jgi:hypothetical protein
MSFSRLICRIIKSRQTKYQTAASSFLTMSRRDNTGLRDALDIQIFKDAKNLLDNGHVERKSQEMMMLILSSS